jgi:Inner centromere protein, ARK binding region
MDMAKYTSGKIPFAEGSNQLRETTHHKTPNQNSQRMAAKPSPQYPTGEHIHLPEIPTDSEDEDSEAEILPVPKWAQPKELEALLREQEGLETDSIFGPIAPFSLEETFKADKKVKKYRDRTSSANWGGPDGLTHEEIRRDIAERQRLRMNGGWTYPPS